MHKLLPHGLGFHYELNCGDKTFFVLRTNGSLVVLTQKLWVKCWKSKTAHLEQKIAEHVLNLSPFCSLSAPLSLCCMLYCIMRPASCTLHWFSVGPLSICCREMAELRERTFYRSFGVAAKTPSDYLLTLIHLYNNFTLLVTDGIVHGT